MVLDSKRSWSNLPYALMPLCVGVCLVLYPWFGGLGASLTGPIMVPFGIVWLVLAFCILRYNSELIFDDERGLVVYRSSLVLHTWENVAEKGNVKRVVLQERDSKFCFVMEVEKGENLSVTPFDYWRSREWSERTAEFLEVPLVDECLREGASEAINLQELAKQSSVNQLPEVTPAGVRFEQSDERSATIWIAPRGLLPSSGPRFGLGVLSLLLGLTVFFLWPKWFLWGFVPGVSLIVWGWGRPLIQATHREEIKVSPHGIHAVITSFGRVYRRSLAPHQIHQLSVIKGDDARFLHIDFDRHAVCVEGPHQHLQLGANLPEVEHVEWLLKVLVFFLSRPLDGDELTNS